MNNAVYVTGLGSFLPNAPVQNSQIEDVLGKVGGLSSRTRALILRNNGIKTRHYALDPKTGQVTHTNAELTAEALRRAAHDAGKPLEALDLLACGTSCPDQLIPNHAAMVHGVLKFPPCEIVSTSGVCCSGVMALKHAWLSVSAGEARFAMSTASEIPSCAIRSSNFPTPERSEQAEKTPSLAFEHDFLRWMLSDGAGAMALAAEPKPLGTSLRIDAIRLWSMADTLETCMYFGARKQPDGSLVGMTRVGSQQAAQRGFLNIGQDARLLDREIIHCAVHAVRRFVSRYGTVAESIDWFLPHLSSMFFYGRVQSALADAGLPIPEERWFTNLSTKGNTGSAAIYIMLDELVGSGRVKAGQRILCLIPESARFSVALMLLTAVDPNRGIA
jgi:3-oxoacyl-[acyl-carrier-protein] synthase-3